MAYSKQNFQDGQILNAANLEAMENGIIAGQGAHNLLDNSDFTNPVNQRGKTSYSGGEYAIDRWKMQSGTNMTLMDGFIRITGEWDTRQYLREKLIGTYTFAVYAKVNVAGGYTQTIEVFENDSPIASSMCTGVGEWKIYTCTTTFTGANNITNPMVIINNRAGSISDASMDVQWAALYEGAYDASTLPAYVPKGKRVEMLNCGVSLAPHNLLDNSDFRIKNNIINTKGLTDYSFDSGNVFDRWRLHWTGDGRVSIKDGYIELYRETHCTYLFQHPRDLQSMVGKTYTVAAKVRYNGRIGWIDSTQRVNSGLLALNDWDIATCTFTVGSATSDIGKAGIEIATKADLSFEVQWVALYEGAYTKETLPTYITKDRHVEMLNCGVPLQPHNLLDNSDFRNPVNQRGQTTYTGSRQTIDRWRTWNNDATITLTSEGIKGDGTDASVLYQGIELHKIKLGTAYTVAAGYSDGTISCGAGTLTTSNSVGIWNSEAQVCLLWSDGSPFVRLWHATKTIQWMVIYPGAYDASTLPAYQPKGYAAELAECKRYYQFIPEQTSCAFSTSAQSGKYFASSINFPQMRIVPTVSLKTDSNGYIGVVQGVAFVSASEFDFAYKLNGTLLPSTTNANYAGKVMSLYGIELSADL